MADKHEPLIKTPKQLLVVVILAFIVPVAVVVMLTQLFTGGETGMKDSEGTVLARIKPVGEVVIAEASGPKGQLTGEQVFTQVCTTCHGQGIAGAPKFGDKAAWAKVIAQGPQVTLQHALNGIRGMPPKGGNADLSDVEVERAVVFMANKADASWKEPPPPANAATAPAAAPNASAEPTTAAPQASATSSSSPKPDGKKVYDTVCMACHGTGVAGAPKFGDKAAWAPRIKSGIDALHASAIKGKGAMPSKGGNTSLSDAEVSAAVDYMVSAAK